MSNSSDISPSRTAPSPELIPMLSDPEISIYETNEIKGLDDYSIEQMNYLLYLSSQCERYQYIIEVFEKLCFINPHMPLSKANRNILEIALKSHIAIKQKRINKLNSLVEYSEKTKTDEAKKEQKNFFKAINKEKERLIDETLDFLLRIMKLIDCHWMKTITMQVNKASDKETEVFLYRIKGDYYKYLSQIEIDADESKKQLNLSNDSFIKACQLSKAHLLITNIDHLNSVYCYSHFINFYIKDAVKAEKLLYDIISNETIINIYQGKELISIETIELIKTIYQFYNEIRASKLDVVNN